MLAFTLRRAIQAIGVMIAVGIISFSMFRFAGDPVNQIVSIDTSAAERAAVRQSLGLDDPVPVQFVRYFSNAAQFKFGVSYQFRVLLQFSPAGGEPVDGTDAGHAGTRGLRHISRDAIRHPDGGLLGTAARHRADQNIPGGLADRNIAADLPDRYLADLSVLGDAGLAAFVRPRRRGADRLVDHRPAHAIRPEGADPALDHARPVPDDPDHAFGARRNA